MSVTFYCPLAAHPDSAPEVNLSNAHASIQLQMLGLDPSELYGTIPHRLLPDTIRAAMKSRAHGSIEANVEAPSDYVTERGVRVMSAGLSPERLESAQQRLLDLFAWAADNSLDVVYG